MAERIKIAEVAELPPGTGKVCPALGTIIALFNVNGRFHAIDNDCPHRGGPLGRGVLDGSVVTCPLHGWRFDVTTGECLDRTENPLQCHRVEIDGDGVWLEVADRPVAPAGDGHLQYMVRFGTMGYVGRFEADEQMACSRGSRVVVETSRGVEAGEVLVVAGADSVTIDQQPLAGRLLRLMMPEDELLQRGLREGQQRAFEACRQLLAERQLSVELVDAEQLLDGATLIFYFLGEHTPKLADVNAALAREYEGRIEFRQFLKRVEAGCGPGCGTDAAPGCKSPDDNGSCAVGGVCETCRETGEARNPKHESRNKSQ